MKKAAQKKRGRPATGMDPVTAIRLSPELKAAIDAWAVEAGDPVSRSQAIRQILSEYLKRRGCLS